MADDVELRFDTQCQITDFYKDFRNIQDFERTIINFLISIDKEIQKQIISNLHAEIDRNIEIYITNKYFFDGIDTLRVCTDRYNPLKSEIEEQLKATNEIWQEITKVRNSLEAANWNADKIAEERLTNEEERLKGIYKGEQNKLESLFKQKEKSDGHAKKYTENVFGKIYELGRSFLLLLEKYFPVEKENTPTLESTAKEDKSAKSEQKPQTDIEPDMIFRTRMFEKFLFLEQKLIADKYLNDELKWISVNKNGRTDIKRLIIFLVGLLANGYLLPGKDPKIKAFFESRYHIRIGQNFEPARREKYINEYNIVFYDYRF